MEGLVEEGLVVETRCSSASMDGRSLLLVVVVVMAAVAAAAEAVVVVLVVLVVTSNLRLHYY